MINPHPAPRDASLEVTRQIIETCTGPRLDSSPLVHIDVPVLEHSTVQTGTADLLASLATVLKPSAKPAETARQGFGKQFDHSMPYLIGALHEGAFPSANFDYNSNPAAAEGESLLCEMVRKLVGLHDHYSIKSNGLGKMAVNFNEVLLLCYHSTVYAHPQENEQKLVFYTTADNIGELQKVLFIRNNLNLRQVVIESSDLSQKDDCEELQKAIEADIQLQLIPHFLHYQILSLEQLDSQHLKKLHDLAQKHNIRVLLDATKLGVQALRELGLQHFDGDFVSLDLSQLGGPASNIFFLKERPSFREKLVNVPMEYLKTYADIVAQIPKNQSSEVKKVCDADFTAHDYNIGFGNFVPWERLLLLLRALGKKGIRNALETHTKNLGSLNSLLKHQTWIVDSKVHPAWIEIKLQQKHVQFVKCLQNPLLGIELIKDLNEHSILYFYAPCLSELSQIQLESHVQHLGQTLGAQIS